MDDKFKEAFAFGKADAFRSIHGGLGGATPKPVKEITKNDLKLPLSHFYNLSNSKSSY